MRPASEGETDMTCRELTDFLVDHVEGKLPTDVAAEFEDHLAECPSCRAYLANYSATIRLGRASASHPDEGPPPEVPEELVEAVLEARRRPS